MTRGWGAWILVQLRCPRGCKLGFVAAHPEEGPVVITMERALVGVDPGRTETEKQVHGPFLFEELATVSYGCRHSAGELFTEDQVEDLRRLTTRAQRTTQQTYIVEPIR